MRKKNFSLKNNWKIKIIINILNFINIIAFSQNISSFPLYYQQFYSIFLGRCVYNHNTFLYIKLSNKLSFIIYIFLSVLYFLHFLYLFN